MAEQDLIYQQLLKAQEQANADTEEARKQQMLQQLAANLGSAGAQIGAGFATIGGRKQFNPDLSQFENLNKQASDQFAREQGVQKNKLDQIRDKLMTFQKIKEDERARSLFGSQMAANKMALEKGGLELDQLKQLQRSDTPEATLAQTVVMDKYKDALAKSGVTPEQLKGMSPARLESMKGILKLGDDNDLYRMLGLQQRQTEEGRRVEQHEFQKKEANEKRIEKGIDKLSKRTESAQIIPMTQALNQINQVFERRNGSIDKIPKGDVPGLGMLDSSKPNFMSSQDDLTVREGTQTLANLLLNTRSGKAVTDPEFKRFLKEASVGNFGREKDAARFIKKMRDLVYLESKNIESGVPEEALKEYSDTFGAKPSDMLPGKLEKIESKQKPAQLPKVDMVRVQSASGQIGLIPRSKLEEAKKRGAKEI